MRSIETYRPGNWLWDSLNNRYVVALQIGEPMNVECYKNKYLIDIEWVFSLRIDKFPLEEMGFRDSRTGYTRRTLSNESVGLAKDTNNYLLSFRDLVAEIWLVDQLQNAYQDMTGETLKLSLFGSKRLD